MSLCLAGNYSLDELEAFAVNHFSPIVDRNLKLRDFTKEVPCYDDSKALGHFVNIVPNKDLKSLSILWP